MPNPQNKLEDILQNYTPEPNTGCWLWLGRLNDYGYPEQRYLGIPQLVHRIYYRAHKKENIGGKILHHTCLTKSCVNPDHLEPKNSIAEHNKMHHRKRWSWKVTPELELEMVRLYEIHKSLHRVGAILKLSPTTVGTALNRIKNGK